MEVVPVVLAVNVVECVVGVALIVEGAEACSGEACAEIELPPERGSNIASELPRGRTIRRQLRVKMVVGSAERKEAAMFPLQEEDASNDPTLERRRCDGSVVFEPDHHVKADRLGRSAIKV